MSNVKVGDLMLVRHPGIGGGSKIHQVDKVYKRYFTCGNLKWRIDGCMRCIGGSIWHRPTIRPATDADAIAIAAAERRNAVYYYEWRTADQRIIDAVHAIIAAPRQAPNAKADPDAVVGGSGPAPC
jgi:hypothetical protein